MNSIQTAESAQVSLARTWYDRTKVVAVGHYQAAARYSKFHYWLAIPAIVFSAVVGTAVFATIQQQASAWVQICAGLLSVCAAVLSILQLSLGYQEKAEKHRIAGFKYNAVGRRLEEMLAGGDILMADLTATRIQIDSLAQESPHIPRAVHNQMGQFPDIDKWGDK